MNENSPSLPNGTDVLINARQLQEIFPVSPMTVWRYEHDPEIAFPKRIRLRTNGRVYWRLGEVLDWIARRAATERAGLPTFGKPKAKAEKETKAVEESPAGAKEVRLE